MAAVELPNPDAFYARVAEQLGIRADQVRRTVELLQDDRTIPFIARYRKEVTGNLDELQLRQIEDALNEARQLETRRAAILKALEGREIPDTVLKAIRSCDNKTELEQLYQPWKSQRKTRADAAREKGLGSLAAQLKRQEITGSASAVLARYINADRGVPDEAAALDGACDILAEEWSANPQVRSWMMERTSHARLEAKAKRGKSDDSSPFRDYFDHSESLQRAPAHRILAMLRGVSEGILNLSVTLDEAWILPKLERRFIRNPQFVFADRLKKAVADCYRRLLRPATQSSALQDLKQKAERESISVFAANLKEMLMAAPAGARPAIGIDPGFRTGCKVAVVDGTGRFVTHATIFPTPPKSDTKAAAAELSRLIQEHQIELIAVGNGTASRETQSFVQQLLREQHPDVICAMVSESGASIYSASETAAKEYPDLDVTIRGAISIAHRLQDPMAELVKLDPATIGVGQYQHDVDQKELKRVLEREVQSCVSQVGVDANTASVSLLAQVPGIGASLAEKIVTHRDQHGPFPSRQALKKVPRLGAVAFEQAAGFLRIADGDNPLDNSAVHPESYAVVDRMAARLQRPLAQLIRNTSLLDTLSPDEFVTEQTGSNTVTDILDELKRPGRDPRAEFKTVRFDDSVQEVEDLRQGMQLQGVVTNVTAFGAFVDIGVHQDGLLHISQMADHFVENPMNEVSVGEILSVRVLDIDLDRRRISLSRKADPDA